VPTGLAGQLSLRHDELLAQQRVLRDERRPSAKQVGGDTCEEPHNIVHGRSRSLIAHGPGF
jgi:hypothetical protein